MFKFELSQITNFSNTNFRLSSFNSNEFVAFQCKLHHFEELKIRKKLDHFKMETGFEYCHLKLGNKCYDLFSIIIAVLIPLLIKNNVNN